MCFEFLLSIYSIAVFVEYKKKQKIILNNKLNKKNVNLVFMTIWLLLCSTFSHLGVNFFYFAVVFDAADMVIILTQLIAILFTFGRHSINFFIFLKFNSNFHQAFVSLFRRNNTNDV